ncbi:uncharacterized protein LOC125947101 [Dermacentor silvarum]|uniref:uncharacterized protein LOC125947101 n=1 Tax=Dermacentor silvarum TaxID=543639 RepID=UPI002100EAF6|nr:uncharacterized protein LOC125947101 [Dermacentor silvarum]
MPPQFRQAKDIKLVCTFGMTGVLESQIPPDKMCDFIFYTHMYYDTKRKAIIFEYGDTAGSQFTNAAKSYTSTTFGASLAVSLRPAYPPAEKDNIKKAMENLMNDKIMHFGTLNVDVRDYNAAKSGGLQYLKIIELQSVRHFGATTRADQPESASVPPTTIVLSLNRDPGKFNGADEIDFKEWLRQYERVVGEVLQGKTSDHHCALGIFNASDGASLVSIAKSAASDFPEITMLILKVHSEMASQKSKLYTMPPNPDNEDVSQYDMIPLKDVKSHLSSLTGITDRGRYVMLSVGMFARAYQINGGQLGIANTSAVLDYHSACVCESGICERRTGSPYDSMDVTVSVWSQNTIVFFDNIDQIKTKAQSRLDALPKNYSGIAAYNVEMDDFGAKCGSSKFGRLNAIRERVDHALTP